MGITNLKMQEIQAKTAKYRRFLRTIILLVWLFLIISTTTKPAHAQDCISVNWETTPLFSANDLEPGDVISKWVEVTNMTGSDQNIGIWATLISRELLSIPDSNGLDFLSQLLLVITNKGTGETLFGSGGSSYFSDLFTNPGNEIYLSTLPGGQKITYELYVEFPFNKGNEWQSRNAAFDLTLGCIIGEIEDDGLVEGVKDEITPTPTVAITAEWVGPEEEGGDVLGILEVLPKTGHTLVNLRAFAGLTTSIFLFGSRRIIYKNRMRRGS